MEQLRSVLRRRTVEEAATGLEDLREEFQRDEIQPDQMSAVRFEDVLLLLPAQ
jgi:hypothetical protein